MTPPHYFEYFNPRRQDPDRDACLAIFRRILIFFTWLVSTQNNPMARLLGNLAVCILPFLNATNQLIMHEQALGYALPGEFQPSPSPPSENVEPADLNLPNGSPPPGYQDNLSPTPNADENSHSAPDVQPNQHQHNLSDHESHSATDAQPDHNSDLDEYYDYHGTDNDTLSSSSDGTIPELEDIQPPSPSRMIINPPASQNRAVAVVQPLGQQVRAPARAARRRAPNIERANIPVPPPSPAVALARHQPPAIRNRCYICASIGHYWRECRNARAILLANFPQVPGPQPFVANHQPMRRPRGIQLQPNRALNHQAPRGRGAASQGRDAAPRGRGAHRGSQRGAQRGSHRHVFPILR